MNTSNNFECLSATANEIGEGPLWVAAEKSLYWIDSGPTAKTLHKFDAQTREVSTRTLPYRASSVIERASGGLVIGYQKGLALLPGMIGEESNIALSGVDFTDERFNDSSVDSEGRLWIGTFDKNLRAPLGKLYRVEKSGDAALATTIDTGMMMSNGVAWSPDNQRMIFCDTRSLKIYVYEFDPASGTTRNRKVFADFSTRAGKPDGCAMDLDGNLWVAEIGAGQIVKFAPDGRVLDEIVTPVSKPTSVAFGGADMKTLFITSMTFGLSPAELEAQPFAGRLLSLRVNSEGRPVGKMRI